MTSICLCDAFFDGFRALGLAILMECSRGDNVGVAGRGSILAGSICPVPFLASMTGACASEQWRRHSVASSHDGWAREGPESYLIGRSPARSSTTRNTILYQGDAPILGAYSGATEAPLNLPVHGSRNSWPVATSRRQERGVENAPRENHYPAVNSLGRLKYRCSVARRRNHPVRAGHLDWLPRRPPRPFQSSREGPGNADAGSCWRRIMVWFSPF